MNTVPTLYEWAGDMQTFEKLFDVFYDKVLKDDLLGDVLKICLPIILNMFHILWRRFLVVQNFIQQQMEEATTL